VAIDD
jgi:hypothetical protein